MVRTLRLLAWSLVLSSLRAAAAPPEPPLPANLPEGWYARIETSLGTIVARLLPDQAPQSVAHFAALAEGRLEWIDPLTGVTKKGNYYDGLKVHLALAEQRFEVGDPTETGRGAPLIYVPPEGKGPVNFDAAGRLGMTRSSLGRISGVLFFVTAAPLPFLTGAHPCFGEVAVGRDVVRAICGVKTSPRGKPLDPVVLKKVRLEKVGDPKPLPDPVPFTPKPMAFGPRETPKDP